MAEGPTRVPEASVESSATAVEWAAITGGALAAIGITIILLALGPALGLATGNSWSFGTSPPALGIAAGIWLIVTQWLSSGLGGYIAGRLRKKWVGIRTDEVFFRDTAYGLDVGHSYRRRPGNTGFCNDCGRDRRHHHRNTQCDARGCRSRPQGSHQLFFLLIHIATALGGYHRDDD